MMYITRFIRRDGGPAENYKYPSSEKAAEHMHRFSNDTSGLYRNISVIDDDSGTVWGILLFEGRRAVEEFGLGECVTISESESGQKNETYVLVGIDEVFETAELQSAEDCGHSEIVNVRTLRPL